MDAEGMAGLGNVSDAVSVQIVETNMDMDGGAVEKVIGANMEVEEVAGKKENGVVKEGVGTNMKVEESTGKIATVAVQELGSDGISVIAHDDARLLVEENVLLEGNTRISESDNNSQLLIEKASPGLAIEGECIDPESLGSQLEVENAMELTNENDDKADLSVAELVANGRAPVKREFLTPAAVRIMVENGSVTGSVSTNGVWDDRKESRIVPEKKSKRQMKRERLLAKKSTEGICAILARTGDVKQCPYAGNCRFNHDLEGYIAQKPADLPGRCPSLDSGERCSYGLACRFAGTHKECDGDEKFQERRSNTAANELNSLSKELQKLLWKNMGSYPKADAQLQAMGLMSKAFKMRVAGEDKQMQEPEQAEKVEGKDSNRGVMYDADETVTESALETASSATVDCKRVNEPGVDVTVGSEGIIQDVPEHLNKEPVELNHPVMSHATESCLPAQKRLKSELDETMGNSLAYDCPSYNCERTVIHMSTELDEDGYEYESNALDVPRGGDVQAKVEIRKLPPSKDGSGSLYVETKLGNREMKIIDFREKLYLAPLTTVGNLPFRRVCKGLGADITCGEMAMCTNLLQGQASEWALLRRHSSEDIFGVQICGSFPDHVARTAELIEQECAVDFIDINMGCPIDLVVNKGSGSCLLTKPQRLEQIVRVTAAVMENPLTVKLRMGYFEGRNCAHTLMPNLSGWGVSAVTVHGRTRQQRYSKQADWAYVQQCVAAAKENLQVIGNGDVFSYTDWTDHLKNSGSKLSTCMIARGALIKPWLFREIKERRHWDISSGERLDILRQYVHCGLAHWGSDSKGVETTRHFLLEWLSYMHRYIPVGLLEVLPSKLNWRPPSYFGRNDLETMMASESAADWVRITELLLGPTPANFVFNPKHKSNAYDKPENG